jgi:hypothetical protein
MDGNLVGRRRIQVTKEKGVRTREEGKLGGKPLFCETVIVALANALAQSFKGTRLRSLIHY